MSDDAYATLDNARREFIAAADRLANACARGETRNALILTVDARETLADLHAALKTIETAIATEVGVV